MEAMKRIFEESGRTLPEIDHPRILLDLFAVVPEFADDTEKIVSFFLSKVIPVDAYGDNLWFLFSSLLALIFFLTDEERADLVRKGFVQDLEDRMQGLEASGRCRRSTDREAKKWVFLLLGIFATVSSFGKPKMFQVADHLGYSNVPSLYQNWYEGGGLKYT